MPYKTSTIQMLQRLRANRQRSNPLEANETSEQGLTLLECVLAIVIIAITLAMITPPIFLAVATRLQNQKAEQALQLAQAEIDRVRLLVERGNYQNTALPPQTNVTFKNTQPPNTYTADRNNVNLTTGFAVDVDGDGPDYVVQYFRDSGRSSTLATSNPTLLTFKMGVRVYSIRAFEGDQTLSTEPAPLRFTAGQGFQRTQPLAVVYTTVTRSDLKDSFDTYRTYLEE